MIRHKSKGIKVRLKNIDFRVTTKKLGVSKFIFRIRPKLFFKFPLK